MAAEITMPVCLRVGDSEVEAGTLTLEVVPKGVDAAPRIREALAEFLRGVAVILEGPELEDASDAPSGE